MEDDTELPALDQLNEIFSEKAKEALAIAMVTKNGEVLYHFAARGSITHDAGDASYILDMIKTLTDSSR